MANTNARSYPKGIREIRYPSNDIIQRFTSKDYTGTLKLNNETGLFEFDPPLEGSGSASSGTTFAVTQPAHGFSVLQPIYHDGSEFKLANSTAEDTLGIWVVTQVTSDDNFVAAQSGRFEITHSLTPGEFYFVGETDGAITGTEPNNYSNPVIFVESTTHIHVLPYRPSTPSGGAGGGGDVLSVFGRTGAVVAESGDYTKDQVGLGNVLNVEQIPTAEKASANGVATLDGSGKVPISQIPVELQGGIKVVGFWDADTNTPNIGSLALNQGEAYQVSVAGTTNLNGITDWSVNDLAVWSDTIAGNWFKIESTNAVTSVNGYTGTVVLDTDDITEGSINEYYTEARVSANTDVAANTAKVSADGSINTHSDVDTQTIAPVGGQALTWDETNWVPGYIEGTLPAGALGNITYYGEGDWITLPIGSNGQLLTSNGTIPTWQDAPVSLPSGVQGDIIYNNGSDWVVLNAGNAGYKLQTNGAGQNPTWVETEATTRPINPTPVNIVDASTTNITIDNDVKTFTINGTTQAFTCSNSDGTSESICKRILDNSANANAVTLTWDNTNLDWTWDDSVTTTGLSGLAANGIYVLEIEVESATQVFASLTPKAV